MVMTNPTDVREAAVRYPGWRQLTSSRGSFFQRDFIRKQREAGLPLHLIAHEDVLVLRTALHKTASALPTTDLPPLRGSAAGGSPSAVNQPGGGLNAGSQAA